MRASSLTGMIGDVGVEAFLPQFVGMFINRTDDYAVQRENGRYLRVGMPLTWGVVREHVQGKQTIGTYVMNAQGLCRYAVFDADADDGLDGLLHVQTSLANDGVPSYLEASRRGGHLWVLLDGMYRASEVRRWLLSYCPTGVEFYPKQDEGTGYGSLIRLPFGVHRRSGCWYPFLVWNEEYGQVVPVDDSMGEMLQWLAVGARAKMPAWVYETVPPPRTSRPYHTPIVSKEAHTYAYTPDLHATIQEWCQAQDPFALIGRYVALGTSGLGHCPFTEHHRHGCDRHPSFRVYHPRKATGSCWYCYTAGFGGNVFDFLLRYHGLDARTLWHRILAGELA
jgi:TOTE conflict system, Archaeo-Eukaryotic Primase domain/CHC2 zinc finger